MARFDSRALEWLTGGGKVAETELAWVGVAAETGRCALYDRLLVRRTLRMERRVKATWVVLGTQMEAGSYRRAWT